MSLYKIIWEYAIDPKNRSQFEHEYGTKGCWNQLFSASEDHKGSFLHQNDSDPNSYMLIDIWISKTSYEEFLEANRKAYQGFSSTCERLYISEKKLGGYQLIT